MYVPEQLTVDYKQMIVTIIGSAIIFFDLLAECVYYAFTFDFPKIT